MAASRNTFVTPLVIKAYDIHKTMFHKIYPYPLQIFFEQEKMSVKINAILQYKHIPFLISLIVITVLLGFGSCSLLPFLKFLGINSKITVIQLVFCSYFGICSFIEWGVYALYSKSTEIVLVFNQFLAVETKRKIPLFKNRI